MQSNFLLMKRILNPQDIVIGKLIYKGLIQISLSNSSVSLVRKRKHKNETPRHNSSNLRLTLRTMNFYILKFFF